jgi:hypothetical protein
MQNALKLRRLGDFPVSADAIRSSHLYQDLRALGFPEELSMNFGLFDLQVATAINRYARAFGIALDAQLANLRLELHRQWQKDQARQDEDVAVGVIAGASINAAPGGMPFQLPAFPWPQSSQNPNAPTGMDLGFSLPIAENVTIKPGDAVGSKIVTTTQYAVPATLDNFIGLARFINGNMVNIALPGEELGAFNTATPGDTLAFTPLNVRPLPVSGLPPNSDYKVAARVFAPGRTEVLDWPPYRAGANAPQTNPFQVPIKTGTTIAPGQSIGLENDGGGNPVAVLANTNNFAGIAQAVADNKVTYSPAGTTAKSFTTLQIGAVYVVRQDQPGSVTPVAGIPNGVVVKVVFRALTATTGVVLDWIPIQVGDPNGPFLTSNPPSD